VLVEVLTISPPQQSNTRVRKRGRLKRSKLEGEDVKGVSGSEEAEPIFHLLNK